MTWHVAPAPAAHGRTSQQWEKDVQGRGNCRGRGNERERGGDGRVLAGMQMEMAFGKQIHLAANWRQISQVQSCHTSWQASSPSLCFYLSFSPHLSLFSPSLCLSSATLSSYGGRQVQLQEQRITCAIILLLSCRVYLLYCCCFACSILCTFLSLTLCPLCYTLSTSSLHCLFTAVQHLTKSI